uniref:helix-turn-helix domain-containing protein n=1 Tax=Streptococcus mitis TaxID=28037 RepID=UPI0021B5681D
MTKKQKHLTLEDRIDIQTGISQQETFRSIAEKMGKDPSTISKEIKRNRIIHPTSVKSDCTDCPLLKKAPYVCNNCQKKRTDCGFNRYLYYAKKAQEQYKTMLRESREGIPLNKESFYQMDKVLTLGIQKKQSIYHIIQTHNLPVSKATVYRHAKLGYLTAKPIDFPR